MHKRSRLKNAFKIKSFLVLILYIIFMLQIACGTTATNDPAIYFRFLLDQKNGLFQEKTVGDYTYSLQYKPSAYMVLTDNESFPMNTENFIQQEKEYETKQYYTFRIKVASDTQHLDIVTYNLNSEQEYNDRVHYLDNDMQKDIFLVCGKDTSTVSSFIYDKSTDLNDYTSFLISFPCSQNIESNRQFIFYDKKFKSGIIIFTIEAAAIANTPTFLF